MPELPEVQTTVDGLKKSVVGLTIKDCWSDLPKHNITRPDYEDTIKYLPFFQMFKKTVQDQKIVSVERRAKNILINLENNKTILVHMKMTGHLLFGKYSPISKNQKITGWNPVEPETLRDPFNRFVHFVFMFTNGKHLAFSDSRKFGKITILDSKVAHNTKHLKGLGPEPLDKKFTCEVFVERLNKKPSGKIKTVLMDQSIISGIGNIYSDEALWEAGVHPASVVSKIPTPKMHGIFSATISILKKGIDFGGDSMSDYRRIDGTPGDFQNQHNVYRRRDEKCKRPECKGIIERQIIGGRSAHFCNKHQKLFK